MALKLAPHPICDPPLSSASHRRISSGSLLQIFPKATNSAGFRGQKLGGDRGRGVAVAPVVKEGSSAQASLADEQGVGASPHSDSKVVLVVGGTGGVGQLVVASLLSRNIKLQLLVRDPLKAKSLFGIEDEDILKMLKGDTRNPNGIDPAIFKGVTHVICCTGTTAFPSKRWEGDNTPERVDWEGIRNLVSALPRAVKQLVLVSSVGVTKFNELPWSIMNLFGVLKYKKMGEDFVCNSGIPFTIIRAGRLTDGPYTSYDLNTLIKATAGKRRAVIIGQGDKLVGEVSRHVVAEACIQALDIEFTRGQIYEVNSVEVIACPSNRSLSESWRDSMFPSCIITLPTKSRCILDARRDLCSLGFLISLQEAARMMLPFSPIKITCK